MSVLQVCPAPPGDRAPPCALPCCSAAHFIHGASARVHVGPFLHPTLLCMVDVRSSVCNDTAALLMLCNRIPAGTMYVPFSILTSNCRTHVSISFYFCIAGCRLGSRWVLIALLCAIQLKFAEAYTFLLHHGLSHMCETSLLPCTSFLHPQLVSYILLSSPVYFVQQCQLRRVRFCC